MGNKRLKRTILQVVNNQMKDPATAYVKEAYEKMRDMGYSSAEAKEAIAAVLLSEMYTMLGEMKEFSEESYRNGLEEMLEDYGLGGQEEPWLGMSEMLKQGYDALDRDFRDPSAIEPWEKAWEIVKEKVRNAEMPLEIYEVDEATDYEYNLEEWISEMTDSYRRMGEDDRCISFCKEVIDTFAWRQFPPSEFKNCIGNCLMELGRLEESDAWYEAWLEEGREPDAVTACTGYWMARREYRRAEELLDHILKECEGGNDYDGFYAIGAEYCRQIGQEKKAGEFDRMQEEYEERMKEYETEYEDWEMPFFGEGSEQDPWSMEGGLWDMDAKRPQRQEPIVKAKKVYPNDPCPCGSGKKYKKCCGRKE